MATITSNQSGNWSSTSTWVGGSVPAADDLVVIAHGHKVNVTTNIQSTRTGDVTIDGNLHFANGGKMHLHGRMTVNNTSSANANAGEFVNGTTTSGSLLSMTGGSEIKISGSNADQHGIQINSRRWCGVDLQGSEPTLNTNLNGDYDYQSDYMTVDSAANFTAGDMISLYEREVDWRLTPDECFYIHDTDTSNNRIYVRQYVTPEATVLSKSGSTITVDDAKVFRVGYNIIFGTGSNRNVKKITAINGNQITFSTAVSGTVANVKAYVTGNEKPHPDNRSVRRLATSVKTAITSLNSTNQLVVGNASDLSVGDEIMVEAGTDDGTYNYTSGSESNVWRHNILYTISSISGNTLTLNRNLQYKSDVGVLVVRMTRDIVIKACKTDGTDVPDGDQDSARVFFNVKYWTNNGWDDASTRRIKIKYVRFTNLGYNTNDSTNFRAGVNIGGYNGRLQTSTTGSAADNTTIHTSNGISQTGENYVDGCVITAFSLCSNTTRDGDNYPSLCIRHPYGHVNRNNVACGTGNGLWRWSSGYFFKDSGSISMVSNAYNYYNEAMYADHSCVEYMTCRMAEDYGLKINNVRDSYQKHITHIDVRTQHGRGVQFGGLTMDGAKIEKLYVDKYRYTGYDSNISNITVLNSRLYPNQWDMTSSYYDSTKSGVIYPSQFYVFPTGYSDAWRDSGGTSIINLVEHGFKSDETVEIRYRSLRVKKSGKSDYDILLAHDNPKSVVEKLFVPAGVTVKIQSNIYTNSKTYRGDSASISTGDYPYFYARPHIGSEIWRGGRYTDGVDDGFSTGYSWSSTDFTSNRFSNSTQGDLGIGFVEHTQHTSASLGAWEKKEITIQAQDKGYSLAFGYVWFGRTQSHEGMMMKDFKVAFSEAVPNGQKMVSGDASTKSVRASFNTGKKRIGGTRL